MAVCTLSRATEGVGSVVRRETAVPDWKKIGGKNDEMKQGKRKLTKDMDRGCW